MSAGVRHRTQMRGSGTRLWQELAARHGWHPRARVVEVATHGKPEDSREEDRSADPEEESAAELPHQLSTNTAAASTSASIAIAIGDPHLIVLPSRVARFPASNPGRTSKEEAREVSLEPSLSEAALEMPTVPEPLRVGAEQAIVCGIAEE